MVSWPQPSHHPVLASVSLAKGEPGLGELLLVSLALKDTVIVDRRGGGGPVLSCSSVKRLPWSGRLPGQCPHHGPLQAPGRAGYAPQDPSSFLAPAPLCPHATLWPHPAAFQGTRCPSRLQPAHMGQKRGASRQRPPQGPVRAPAPPWLTIWLFKRPYCLEGQGSFLCSSVFLLFRIL